MIIAINCDIRGEGFRRMKALVFTLHVVKYNPRSPCVLI